MLLSRALGRFVLMGRIRLIDANGNVHEIAGTEDGPVCAIRLHDHALHRTLVTNPWLKIGEAYMDGTLTIEGGTLDDFIEFLCMNAALSEDNPAFRLNQWLGYRMRWFQQHNPVGRAQMNVAHHYDLSYARKLVTA